MRSAMGVPARVAVVAVAALALVAPGAVSPADAAPPGPQCATNVRECGPPFDIVERIIRTCQQAYCQFP